MPRLAFKPDSSFFRKISMGAVSAQAVVRDLDRKGHRMAELERGSTDTKLWKDVKRKRVRIPDLVCLRCGIRVECRAKTKLKVAMSHSPDDETRAWDFGMIDSDWVAFPVSVAVAEEIWSRGRMREEATYWNERNWVKWTVEGHINYFSVAGLRATPPVRVTTKGVTEGSESSVEWEVTSSTRIGTVERVSGDNISIRRTVDRHLHTWRIPEGRATRVVEGQEVAEHQVIASSVAPVSAQDVQCGELLTPERIARLLESRERTQRFTGVKLARLLRVPDFAELIDNILGDLEEDVYVRLEAATYLADVCARPIDPLFGPFFQGHDQPTQLEAVIALGEVANEEAVGRLCRLLDSGDNPYFLRSAAAWSLSRIGSEESVRRLIRAFRDLDPTIREEALEGIVTLGGAAVPQLLDGILETDSDIAAGCAESIRQQRPITDDIVHRIMVTLEQEKPPLWAVWLAGNLPRERVSGRIFPLRERSPELHYALNVLWCFIESWIARRWELNPHAGVILPNDH